MSDGKTRPALDKKRGPRKSARSMVAEAAGMSRQEAWRCMQVANIPQDEFEALVESDDPPTMGKLVKIGQGETSITQSRRLRRCPHCGGDLTQSGQADGESVAVESERKP